MRFVVRCVLWAIAAGATFVALKTNLDLAALMYAKDGDARFNYQTFAVASAAAKLAIPAALAVLVGVPRLAKMAGWAVVGLFIFFDVVGAIAYDDLTRGAPAAHAQADAVKRAKLEAERNDWRERADAIKARTAAELDEKIKTADAKAAACGRLLKLTEPTCTEPAELRAERARALEKQGFLSEWDRTRKELAALKDVETPPADALATALFRVLGAIGLKPSPDAAALIVAFRLIVVFEILPSLASFLAMLGVGRKAAPAPAGPTPPPAPPAGPSGGPRGRPATGGGVDVLTALKELADGTRAAAGVSAGPSGLRGSQRALAVAVGVSPAKLNTALRDLAAAGALALNAGPGGTAIQLK